jgi:hypothetical protein
MVPLGTSLELSVLGPCNPTWSLDGPGTLVAGEDPKTVVYTAPASSSSLEEACYGAKISVMCELGSDSLDIDITGGSGAAAQMYEITGCTGGLYTGYCQCVYNVYMMRCNGTTFFWGSRVLSRSTAGQGDAACIWAVQKEICGADGTGDDPDSSAYLKSSSGTYPSYEQCTTWTDMRTGSQIAAGCCPTIYPVNPFYPALWWDDPLNPPYDAYEDPPF